MSKIAVADELAKKITTQAVADKLASNPACDACIGFGVEIENENNTDQDEKRWLGTELDEGYNDRGVGQQARIRILTWAAVLLRHGRRVRVYVIEERTYPTTISSACIVLDPRDFAE